MIEETSNLESAVEGESDGVPALAEPVLSGRAEAQARHDWDVANLRDLRERRDHLNDLIREAVKQEDLSRRALAVYKKADDGS